MAAERKSSGNGNDDEASSLTSPADRVTKMVRGKKRVRFSNMRPTAARLTEQEADVAVGEMLDTSAVDELHRFPKVERQYSYPAYKGLNYVAVSFLPSKTAVPDKDGVFGMMRMWGAYATLEEAEAHSAYIITHHDSYHPVNVAKSATPFFITAEKKYSAVTTKIRLDDVSKRMITESVKEQIKKDKENTRELLRREEALLKGRKSMKMPGQSDDDDENTGMDDYGAHLSQEEKYAEILTKQYAQLCTILRAEKKVRNYKRAYLSSVRSLRAFEAALGPDDGALFEKACALVAKEHASIGIEMKNTAYLVSEYGCMRDAGSNISFRGLDACDKHEKESSELEPLSALILELQKSEGKTPRKTPRKR